MMFRSVSAQMNDITAYNTSKNVVTQQSALQAAEQGNKLTHGFWDFAVTQEAIRN